MICKLWKISPLLLCVYINITQICGVFYYRNNEGHTTIPSDIEADATAIDLSQNDLTDIHSAEFSIYTSLTTLILSNNRISFISDDAFEGLSNIEELYLNENNLATFPNFNADLKFSLRILDLSRNNISYIPGISYHFLEELNLAYNPIDWTAGGLDGVLAYTGTLRRLDVSHTECTG